MVTEKFYRRYALAVTLHVNEIRELFLKWQAVPKTEDYLTERTAAWWAYDEAIRKHMLRMQQSRDAAELVEARVYADMAALPEHPVC